jgi:hypothetical protein
VADRLEREPVTVEDGRFVDVLVAELRTHSTPRDTVALKMREHCGAVDLEVSGELENRVAFRVCSSQPFDVSGSGLDLSSPRLLERSRPPHDLRQAHGGPDRRQLRRQRSSTPTPAQTRVSPGRLAVLGAHGPGRPLRCGVPGACGTPAAAAVVVHATSPDEMHGAARS